MINESLIKKIVSDTHKKKELSTISNDFIKEKIIYFLRSNPKLAEFLTKHEPKTLERSGKYKNLIKTIRAELRKAYGLFSTKETVLRDKYLKDKDYNSILKSHVSTKERMRIYPRIYQKIWTITGKPESLIDLGCGMNPFSFDYMLLETVKYFASDISQEDCNFIQKYFDSEPKIIGKTEVVNVLKADLSKLPESNVCFLFKLLDPALVKNKKTAERIIVSVPARWVIASFSTKTVSGRTMNEASRDWIKKMCERLDFKLHELEFENEIFYVIQK